MKVVVDFDLCESNAVCMGIVPEVFEVRDDDVLYVLDEHPDSALHVTLLSATSAVWLVAAGEAWAFGVASEARTTHRLHLR